MDELIPSQHHTTLVSSPKSYGCFLFFLNEVKWVKQKREIENCAHNNDIRIFFFLDLFSFSFRSYMEGLKAQVDKQLYSKKKKKKKFHKQLATFYNIVYLSLTQAKADHHKQQQQKRNPQV
jgi:hypothetical protein